MALPTFPECVPLTIEDRATYEALVATYPPLSNISFPSLHIWWNFDDKLAVSLLHGNLVIYYHIAYDPKNSGHSLIGTHNLEKSFDILFDHLAGQHKPLRLVHIPEFVIKKLTNKTRFNIEEEADYHEYILSSEDLAKLEGSLHGRNRRRINRFLREVKNKEIGVRELDLSSPVARNQLFKTVLKWGKIQTSDNDPDHIEHIALQKTLTHAVALDIRNLGLFINGTICAIVLYHQTLDKRYYILNHLKVDYSIRYTFDYMTHLIAQHAVEQKVPFLNMEMDLGIENLREHKMGLRPVDFFRQYTVNPVGKK